MVRKIGQDDSLERTTICRQCGAKLAYLPKDVKWESVCYMGESEVTAHIVCPTCNRQVHVPVARQ